MFTSSTVARVFTGYIPRPDTTPSDAALCDAVRQGDEDAFMALALRYAPALRRLAAEFRATLGVDEAQQAALVGMLEVIHDPERFGSAGKPFRALLVPGARKALTATVRATRPGATVSARVEERYLALMRQANGDASTALHQLDEKADHMTAETFLSAHSALSCTSHTSYLDSAAEAGQGSWDAHVASDDDPILAAEVRMLARKALDAITDPNDRAVVTLAYGFGDDDPMSDAEIAQALGMHRSSVYKIRQRALDVMRTSLGA